MVNKVIEILYLFLNIYLSVWLALTVFMVTGFFVVNKLDLNEEVYTIIHENTKYQYDKVEILIVYALLRPVVWPFLVLNCLQYSTPFTEVIFLED